jgi:hypothetical protein
MTGRRRGYVIIEMLLVMTALAIILGLCVGLIHCLHRLSRVGTDHLAEATARDRLARQFRQDVRAASRSSLAGADVNPAGRVELHGPGQRVIDYVPGDGWLVRTERDGGQQLRREDYRFPSGAAVRFRTRDEDGARFVILSLRRDAASSIRGPHHESEFEAELGRDARLSRRQGDGS